MAIHYKFLTTSEQDTLLANYQKIHCENFINDKITLCNIDITSNTEGITSEKVTCSDCLEIIKRCKEVKTSEISYAEQRIEAPYECFKLNWELQKGRIRILDLAHYKAFIITSEGLELIHKQNNKKIKIWNQLWMEEAIRYKDYQSHYLDFYYFTDDSIYDYAKERKILIWPGEDWKIILKYGRKK